MVARTWSQAVGPTTCGFEMRLLSSVTPTREQLQLIGDVKPGFRLIRGAAGGGKTTTALLCLQGLIRARLSLNPPTGWMVTYPRGP